MLLGLGFGRQVAVEVELVALELHPHGFPGEVGHGQAAAEGAVVQLEVQAFEGKAVGTAIELGDQLEFLQGGGVAHGRQFDADAGEELAQVERGDGQAAFQARVLVEVAHFQFTEGAQLVAGELEAVPFGDVGGQVGEQLALGVEGEGLAFQRLARGLAVQLEVFQLVALDGAFEAQVGSEVGLGAQYRLIGAEEGAELERNAGAFADGASGQLDALGGKLFAALGIGVVDAGVAHSQAVDIQLDRTGRLGGGGLPGLFGRCGRGRRAGLGGFRGPGRVADVFPVAVALVVALQVEVEAFDADVAHLHFTAQQRHDADRQADHVEVGEGLFRGCGAGQGCLVQFEAEPGEQAPADIAVEGQFEVGLLASQLLNLVLVIIRVEQVGQGEACRHDDQQQPEEDEAQDFAEGFHWPVLVMDRVN
ncbi:hypothetical protein D9M71_270730 [compost metagenome]